MPWETAGKARLPKDWHQRRARVLRRDGHRCQYPRHSGGVCGQPANTCDHVVPFVEGGTDDESNLRALCEDHHYRKTAQEAARGRERQRAPRRRGEEPHPGRWR